MNWKLIFLLSLFGLAMAFVTVFWIPTKAEPGIWLIIFAVCARAIARFAPGKYFLHGLAVGIVNSFWITCVHVLLFTSYMASHPDMAEMNARMPMSNHPRLLMVVTGPLIGVISGLILGLFAFLATKIKRNPQAA